jgi:DNA-binding NarL/FixJ family response regulator
MSVAPNSIEQSVPVLRVLLADDHEKVLESARRLLGSDYQVVAAVSDGVKAVEAARMLSPDLILLDIEMPGMDGIRAAQEMRRSGSKARILFLTVHDEEDFIAAARRLGDGYVLKSRMGSDLRHAIDEAFSGGFFVSHRTR